MDKLCYGTNEIILDKNIIYSLPFSIELFKMLPEYTDLEVIIQPDGMIHYALPSHQEFLIHLAMEIHDCSRDELMEMCPPEYYGDFTNWLCIQTDGCISVWPKFFLGSTPTKAQKNSLKKLKLAGVYSGRITRPGY